MHDGRNATKPLRENPIAVGLGAALLASLCCAPPVLLVALGFATSSALLAWLDLKPLFLALAALCLIAGLAASLLRGRRACSARRFGRRLWLYPLVTVIAFGAGYWLLMGVATPRLYAQVYASEHRVVTRGGLVTEPDGRVVALRRATFTINPGCDGCAATLGAVLRGLPGVHAADVSIQRSEAMVLYDPTRTTARGIEGKIPYRWFFTPRLRGDVAMAAAPTQLASSLSSGSTPILLLLAAGMLAMTSAAIWSVTRTR